MTKTSDNRKINVFKDGHCPPPGSVLANWAQFLPPSVVSRSFGMNIARKPLSPSVVSVVAGNWFCCFCCRVSVAVGLQFELLCGVCNLIGLFILLWNEEKSCHDQTRRKIFRRVNFERVWRKRNEVCFTLKTSDPHLPETKIQACCVNHNLFLLDSQLQITQGVNY